ncbi:MAG: hypothetical protein AAF798_13450 [Bacteroidota bacterium]
MKRVKVIDFTNFGIGGLAVAYLAAYAQKSGSIHWEKGSTFEESSKDYTPVFEKLLQADHMEFSLAADPKKMKSAEPDLTVHLYDQQGANTSRKGIWSFYYPDCAHQIEANLTLFSETIKKDMLIFISKELL